MKTQIFSYFFSWKITHKFFLNNPLLQGDSKNFKLPGNFVSLEPFKTLHHNDHNSIQKQSKTSDFSTKIFCF